MSGARLLTAMGLVRAARPGGFCPACRVLMKARDARPELARPKLGPPLSMRHELALSLALVSRSAWRTS